MLTPIELTGQLQADICLLESIIAMLCEEASQGTVATLNEVSAITVRERINDAVESHATRWRAYRAIGVDQQED